MWWARSELAEVYLGTTKVGVRRKTFEAWVDVPGPESGANQVIELLRKSGPAKGRVRVWLSAALSRAFMVPADCGARADEEAVAIAHAMAAQATGMSGELSIWSESWDAQRGCLAVAVPAGTRAVLLEGCAAAGLRLWSMKPWWNLAIDQALSQARAGGVRILWSLAEPDAMTIGTLSAGTVNAIDTLEPSAHDPGWAHGRARARAGHGSGLAQWHAEADLGSEESQELPIGGWRFMSMAVAEPIREGSIIEAQAA